VPQQIARPALPGITREWPMADQTSVSGTVKIDNDSADRVAFDLMKQIAMHEAKTTAKDGRDYWLTLYWQCRKATYSTDLTKILLRTSQP